MEQLLHEYRHWSNPFANWRSANGLSTKNVTIGRARMVSQWMSCDEGAWKRTAKSEYQPHPTTTTTTQLRKTKIQIRIELAKYDRRCVKCVVVRFLVWFWVLLRPSHHFLFWFSLIYTNANNTQHKTHNEEWKLNVMASICSYTSLHTNTLNQLKTNCARVLYTKSPGI